MNVLNIKYINIEPKILSNILYDKYEKSYFKKVVKKLFQYLMKT